jgi:hypothetical protein
MNEPEGTKRSPSSKSVFPLKIWRKVKKFVKLPLDKVFALGKAKINKIYFVFLSRFITFAVDYAEWEE